MSHLEALLAYTAPMAAWLDYTHCLVRDLPETFENGLKLALPSQPIDVEMARQQHQAYVQLMQQLVPNVIRIEADDNHPDCVFVEDTAIVVGSSAIMSYMGAPERRGEVGPVRKTLQSLHHVSTRQPFCIAELQPPATLDGGDVMFTGTALWVGLTKRTNEAAVQQLQQLFEPSGIQVYPFDLGGSATTLHLKSVLSLLAPDCILVADNEVGRSLVKQAHAIPAIAQSCSFSYVPDQLCSNILRIGNHVVAQAGYARSEEIIRQRCEERGLKLHLLAMSETAKADGALTCCSILMRLAS